MTGIVTSLVVNQAEKALKDTMPTRADIDKEAGVATFRGKKYTHWSQYVTLSGAWLAPWRPSLAS